MIVSSLPGVIDKSSAIGPFALSLVVMGLSVCYFMFKVIEAYVEPIAQVLALAVSNPTSHL